MTMIVPLVLVSLVVGALGKNRKFGFWGYFFLSLLATPVIGMLALVLTGSETERKREV